MPRNTFKTLVVLLLMLFNQNLLADDQTLSLLKELKAEIQTLKTNAEIASEALSALKSRAVNGATMSPP